MGTKNAYAVGIDLGGTKIEAGLLSSNGEILEITHQLTKKEGGPEVVVAQLTEIIKELIGNRDSASIVGVSLGVPGQVDLEGNVIFAPNLRWHNFPLKEVLAKQVNLPILVTNDVRAITYGEWRFGAGKGCQDFVVMMIGTGIGGGVVSGGRLLLGNSNTCGEIGHMRVALNDYPCTCGGRGCIEAIAGGWAIAKRAQEAIMANSESGTRLLSLANGNIDNIDARLVFLAEKEGDPLALSITALAKEALIQACLSLVHLLNPEKIILGGGIIQGRPEWVEFIEAGIRQRAMKAAIPHLQVRPTGLSHAAGVVGAAALVFQSE